MYALAIVTNGFVGKTVFIDSFSSESIEKGLGKLNIPLVKWNDILESIDNCQYADYGHQCTIQIFGIE